MAQEPRHYVVQSDYDRDRFMAHLDRRALDERAKHIFGAMYRVDEEGRIGLHADAMVGRFWIDRFTEVIREYALRRIPTEDFGAVMATEESLAQGRRARFESLGRVAKRFTPPAGRYFVKFLLQEHAHEMIATGRIRVAPADSFSDPSLNQARRDVELKHQVDADVSLLPFAPEGHTPSFMGNPLSGRARVTAQADSNFYVYCVSGGFLPRLFNDFNCTSAVVIRDPVAFYERFQRASLSRLPGWRFRAEPVEYYDPLCVSPTEIRIPFSKYFGYAYQQEVRSVIEPVAPVQNLPVLFLELGPLGDIAEVLSVDNDGE
jgi:hypothetical protein